jgi:alkylation response protein AidB-like acyl-CoA dehydrogenase
MRAVYTEHQAQYHEYVHGFAEGVLRPLVEQKYDFSRPLNREEIAALRGDVARHDIATSAPLLDDGRLDLVCTGIFIEEISRVNLCLASLATALFFPVWDPTDLLSEGQRERYASWFTAGEMVSIAISEPDAGSNPSQIETVARRVDDGWLLSGRKLWISHAQLAAGIMVAARKQGGEGDEVSLFMVDREEQDYDVRTIACLGMEATCPCEVVFEDCYVPAEAELTPGKGGLRSALGLVEQSRLKTVFMAVGVAQASLDQAVSYAKDRTQFGRPIGSFQLIQELLADMAMQIEAARLLGYRTASLIAAGQSARAEMSMAKVYASEMAIRVASAGIQVLGAIGLTKEAQAERYLRDARMLTVPSGTTQVHQLVVGRELTGVSAFVSRTAG